MGQPSRTIDAQIQAGDVSGQIAVGDHIYQNQYLSAAGDIVFRQADASLTELKRLSEPVRPALRRFRGFVGRAGELAAVLRALGDGEPVELYGRPGIGKSSFLRRMAEEDLAFGDGAFYARARDQGPNDLKQTLVNAFYESALPVVLQPGQFGRYLGSLQALIMLDDVDLPTDDILEVMDAAAGCTFVVVGEAQRLRGEARAVGLAGLPAEEAVALLERELGRTLDAAEQAAALTICQALEGHPANVLAEAARLRDSGQSLAEAAAELGAAELAPETAGATATERLQDKTAGELSPTERQILALLQTMGDVPLHQEHIQAVVGRADVLPALKSMQGRQLAQAHSPSYTVTALMADAPAEAEAVAGDESEPWSDKLLAHFVDWTGQVKEAPDQLQERMAAILRMLSWGWANGRWAETLALARNIQDALALARRWDAWERVLKAALAAAQAMEEPAAAAWALHQLGTRALCLGDDETAEENLTRALEMRQFLGDEAGAAATRHNLDTLRRTPPPTLDSPLEPSEGGSGSGAKVVAFALLALMILVIGLLLGPGRSRTAEGRAAQAADTQAAAAQAASAQAAAAQAADAQAAPASVPAAQATVAVAEETGPEDDRPADPTLQEVAATSVPVATVGPGVNQPNPTATDESSQSPRTAAQVRSVDGELIALGDSASTQEDRPIAIRVLANDRLPDGSGEATLSVLEPPRRGSVERTASNNLRYVPQADYFGTDSFRYQVCVEDGRCAANLVVVRVDPVNDLPQAGPDQVEVERGDQVLVAILENDRDLEDTFVRLTRVFAAHNGTVTNLADGRVRYEPDPGYCGPDSFRYEIRDSDDGMATGKVSVEVRCPNQPPQVRADSQRVDEDEPADIDVLANDVDVDDNLDPDTLIIVTQPSNGRVTVAADRRLTYTPGPNYAGPDSFTYRICDQERACGQARVTLTVDPIPDQPLAADDTASVNESGQVSIDVLANDSDPDGDPLRVLSVSQPDSGRAAIDDSGEVVYTPGAGFCGTSDSFTYRVGDRDGLNDEASVSVQVLCVNAAPVARNDSATGSFNSVQTISVLQNDSDPDDGDTLTVTGVGAPSSGTAFVVQDGQRVSYSPQTGFAGQDSFSYTVCDQGNRCDSALVSVVVRPPMVTLALFWSDDLDDFYTTTAASLGLYCSGTLDDDRYRPVQVEALLSAWGYSAPAGMIPLRTYRDSGETDYLTTTAAAPDGYNQVRNEGYVYDPGGAQPANTVPIYRYRSPATGDHLLTTRDNPNNWNQIPAYDGPTDYELVRLEGYASISSPCRVAR